MATACFLACVALCTAQHQRQQPYDPKRLTTATAFSLPYYERKGDGYWGYRAANGVTYVISSDQQLVRAYKVGQLIWTVKAVDLCMRAGNTSRAKFAPYHGMAVIRHVSVHGNEMWLTVGKHDYCRIDMLSGKADCDMAD